MYIRASCKVAERRLEQALSGTGMIWEMKAHPTLLSLEDKKLALYDVTSAHMVLLSLFVCSYICVADSVDVNQ